VGYGIGDVSGHRDDVVHSVTEELMNLGGVSDLG
jgi:hypothetical protein